MKKYNQYAIKNREGQYIKYSTAYSYNMSFTDCLYDVHLWKDRNDAEKLKKHLMQVEGLEGLGVILV